MITQSIVLSVNRILHPNDGQAIIEAKNIISSKSSLLCDISIFLLPQSFIGMENIKLLVLAATLLLKLVSAQNCLTHGRKTVDWFVIIIPPQTVSKGYLYFDSISTNFTRYEASPDTEGEPLFNTLSSISNSEYQIIAWNDQLPNGSTSSSKAHSKTVVAINEAKGTGLFLDHSMPTYPAIKDKTINETRSSSQRVYGQHVLCFGSGVHTAALLGRASNINPYYYSSNNKFTFPSSSLFQSYDLKAGSTTLRALFKNGKINGSIFEDGLAPMLSSALIAETWGRPIMQPWCGGEGNGYPVENAELIRWGSVEWKRTQDHSKWTIATEELADESCFGDMNRMESQFKRGGAFYCLKSRKLRDALLSMIQGKTVCQ